MKPVSHVAGATATGLHSLSSFNLCLIQLPSAVHVPHSTKSIDYRLW